MRGLSDIPSAGVCDVGAAPGAGRESNIIVELSRCRSPVPNATASHLHVFRARMQMDISGGATHRRGSGRDDVGRRCHPASRQSASVVSADQPDAVVVVAAVAASPQDREHGQADQLQAQADSTAGHHYPGSMRTTGRRVGSS